MQPARGFTLIELIVVIVLMGLLAVAGVDVIRFSADAYSATVRRAALSGAARVAIDRVTRELRHALPNSVRESGGCIEFIPVTAASTYLTLPVDAAATTFTAAPFPSGITATSGRIAVYPLSLQTYDLSADVLSGVATWSVPDVNNEVTITLPAAHQFPNHSPLRRFFVVGTPVSFCLTGTSVFRYQNYGFNTAQLAPGAMPAGTPDRALLANNVDSVTSAFSVSAGTLQRNALAIMDLVFTSHGETVRVAHEVRLRNVP